MWQLRRDVSKRHYQITRLLNDHVAELPNCLMTTAVLLSGGLDSAVLLADEAVRADVQPIYVSAGLAWESAERSMIEALLRSDAFAGHARNLVTLSVDMRDVYAATHWAVTGTPPAYHTPDEDVYLPGRNIILLAKAGVYCAAAGIGRLVLGTLGHNPFPDATPEFRSTMARALTLGLAHGLQVDAPFADMSKAEVIRRGVALGVPLELTLSCMSPRNRVREVREVPWVHCGTCSKCRERHDAFVEVGAVDPTDYHDASFTRGPG
jgi:7-cyano-7-deazaguanine synthase